MNCKDKISSKSTSKASLHSVPVFKSPSLRPTHAPTAPAPRSSLRSTARVQTARVSFSVKSPVVFEGPVPAPDSSASTVEEPPGGEPCNEWDLPAPAPVASPCLARQRSTRHVVLMNDSDEPQMSPSSGLRSCRGRRATPFASRMVSPEDSDSLSEGELPPMTPRV